MSFKTKRWGLLRRVDMADFIPGIKGSVSGGAIAGGFSVPWQGQILVAAYLEDNTPCWAIYHPYTHTVTGPFTDNCPSYWRLYSYSYGWNTRFSQWGDRYWMGTPGTAYFYGGSSNFFGWDANFNYLRPTWEVGERTNSNNSPGIGWDGSEPCVLSYQYERNNVPATAGIAKTTLYGSQMIYDGDDVYFTTTYGSTHFGMQLLGQYYAWTIHVDDDLTGGLFTHVPTDDTHEDYLHYGSFGDSLRAYGNGAWCSHTVEALGGLYWTEAGSPLASADRPWQTEWHWRQQKDGGYSLSDYDLDGVHHGVYEAPPGTNPISLNQQLGWYMGLDDIIHETAFDLWVLDPYQPTPLRRASRPAGSGQVLFMGDYGIGDDHKLSHVLPFPDERNPCGVNRPPQDRLDGKIIGETEIFQRRGNAIEYRRDVKIQLVGYPFNSSDWWFPGEDENHCFDEMWELFGGATTIIGRYPDPMWGGLNPLGMDVKYGLGVPQETLDAQEPNPTHVVRSNQVVSGTTSWVKPTMAGSYGQYRVVRGNLYDQRMTYVEAGVRLGAPPAWKARGGLNNAGTWQTIVDFEEISMPQLGNDGWTILSVCTIPRCASLPRGGWLVGAELYFAPWDEWEFSVGSRDLTFRDTGFYGVPAVPGYIGPLNTEEWHPKLLSAYDEWTAGRSDHGAAGLLVFDYDGQFVECLNGFEMYPPTGREVSIIPGGRMRLLYRVKGGGVYSDSAEGWGAYHAADIPGDLQAPLFAVYELDGRNWGANGGDFVGWVDMYDMEQYEPKLETWRWGAVSTSYDTLSPRNIWAPYGHVRVREAVGGSGITILSPGNGQGRSGIKGVGRR